MIRSRAAIYFTVFAVLAACLVFAIAWPTLHANLSLEDWINVRTGYVPNFGAFLKVFTHPWPYNTSSGANLNWQGVSALNGDHYEPLFSLSFFIDRSIWGLNSFGFRLTNAFLYIFCGIFVFYLAYLIFKKWVAAFLAGTIYLLQAVHYPALLVVNTRTESLMAFFGLPAIIFYLLYREKKERLYYWLSVATFFLAFMSKENAVFIPMVILLYDILYRYSLGKKKIIADFMGFCGAIFIYLILRVVALGGLGEYSQLSSGYFGQYPFLIAKGLLLSLYDLVFAVAGNISSVQNYFWLVALFGIVSIVAIIRVLSYKDREFYKRTIFFAVSYFLLVAITLPIFSARYLFLPSVFADLFIVDVLIMLSIHIDNLWDKSLMVGFSITFLAMALLWTLTWTSLDQGVIASNFWLNKFYTEMPELLPTISDNQKVFLLDAPSEIGGFGLVTIAQAWFSDHYSDSSPEVYTLSLIFSRTNLLPGITLGNLGGGKFTMTLVPNIANSYTNRTAPFLQKIINKISIVNPDTDQAIYLPELDMAKITNGEAIDNAFAQYKILQGSGYGIKEIEVDMGQVSPSGARPAYVFFNGSDFVKVN